MAAMLRDWWRLKETFRAFWRTDHDKPLVIYRPFLTPAERRALAGDEARKEGGVTAAPMTIQAWLNGARAASLDALDLRLHEAWWHGILDKDDAPHIKGIGANTAATRTRTTRPEERNLALGHVGGRWTMVVLYA